MAILKWPWDMIAAALSAAVLISYLVVEFIFPWNRRRKLKRPCDVSFVIPADRDSQQCEYAILDEEWHLTKEITVPAHKDIHLEFRLVPHLNFVESEFAFGCDGDENLGAKPIALEFFSSFVDRGKAKKASPEENEHHFTDRHQYYHIKRNEARSVGQHYIAGFITRTREPGIYRADVEVTTEQRQGCHKLKIRVESPPKTLMKCIAHKGCYIKPRVPIGP
jgi:hypothetical protein